MDGSELLAVAADLDWPPVEVGRLTVAGEDAWRQALTGFPSTIPAERLTMLAGLAPSLLVATPAARERLAAWQTLPPRPDESPEELRARLRESVVSYGDLAMLPAVVEAFATIPAPVRETLLGDVAIMGTGWSTRGWCGPAIAPGPAYLIMLSGASRNAADLAHTARHELAHAWLKEPRPLLPAKTMAGQANVRALAEAEGWFVIPAVDANRAREERLAEACAQAWGLAR